MDADRNTVNFWFHDVIDAVAFEVFADRGVPDSQGLESVFILQPVSFPGRWTWDPGRNQSYHSRDGRTWGNLYLLLAAMRAGNTYTNIHTGTYSDGEIRGQNQPGQ